MTMKVNPSPSEQGRAAACVTVQSGDAGRVVAPARRRMSRGLPIACLAGLFALLSLVGGCADDTGGARELLALDGRTMGTTWSVRVAAPPPGLREAALRADVEARLVRINALMSTWDPASELSRFNAAPIGEWFAVDAELVAVVEAARTLGELSEGAFDVTVGPLVNLWGFGPQAEVGRDAVPSEAALEAALRRVGFAGVETRRAPPALRRTADLEVDLSAIAKGYGVDAVASILEAHGVQRYLAEIGGELRARGHNARDVPWQVGIETPDAQQRGVAREAIGLDGAAVATSGDYRNFFTVDGVRYSHTIDPTTGRPVTHDVASVTVIHSSAMWADGWATALNVMGAERGLALAAEQDLAVLFILYEADDRPDEGEVGGDESRDGRFVERPSEPFQTYRARSAP